MGTKRDLEALETRRLEGARRLKRDEQDGRVAIAFLPPYAPEMNPVEAI